MDEDVIRDILSAQDGVDLTPTAEMMMMNSDMPDDLDGIDPALLAALQQQQDRQEMAALAGASQSMRTNPSVITTTAISEINDDDEDFEDETIVERIVALKEMFPESVQNAVGSVNRALVNGSKLALSKGRTATWW